MTLIIAGISGRMGQRLLQLAPTQGLTVLAGLDRAPAEITRGKGDVLPILTDPADIPATAKCVIDFSAPALTKMAVMSAPSSVDIFVIGTTGLSDEDMTHVRDRAKSARIVYARNFSLGVNLLAMLSEQVASRLGHEWDAEIHETHHRHKADAPSGTALMLAEAVVKGSGEAEEQKRSMSGPYLTETGARVPGGIGMSVSRLGGVFGDHSVTFGTESETLQLSHTALNRDVFAQGALHAAKWAEAQPNGLYSMRDVLGTLF